MRNAPVSHKLMCRWSYPLYIYLTDVHPRNTYPHVPIQQGCRDILSSPDGADIEAVLSLSPGGVTKTGIEAVPLSTPWRRDEADSMQGGQACHGRVALMIKYFRTYVF